MTSPTAAPSLSNESTSSDVVSKFSSEIVMLLLLPQRQLRRARSLTQMQLTTLLE